MTKFSEEFMTKVNDHLKENKSKPLGENIGGVHQKYKSIKKIMVHLKYHFKKQKIF